jgi:tripartite-type tricarboxylate transporter receptor subunit TctC
MDITRKRFLQSAAAFAATVGGIGSAQAQEFPSQDIHLVSGFPPGAGSDVLVRYFGEKLRIVSGRNVIVDSKVGANSAIAMEYVARSKPDGYTLYPFSGTTTAASMYLYKNPPVDVGKAFTVAATTSNLAFMLSVDVNSPYKTVKELTDAMKKKGPAASYAVASVPGMIMAAIYKNATGVDAVEVSYKNAIDSMNEIQGGKIDFAFHDPIFTLAQAREGRLRVLGVSSSERLNAAPDYPTMKEAGVPMDLNMWWGVLLPAATPKPVIAKINDMFKEIIGSEETRKFLALSGADPLIRTPEQAAEMFQVAIREWGDYVKLAKIPPI